jgi:hypothetical protein
MTKVEQLKELKGLLDQNLINQEEYERLRTEILQAISPLLPRGGRPFDVPAAPLKQETHLKNPVTGQVITLRKWPTFGLTLLFGSFYMAYHGAWWHALISLALAWVTMGFAWLIYPFFAYHFLVDSYRRRGWVVWAATVVQPPPARQSEWGEVMGRLKEMQKRSPYRKAEPTDHTESQ